MRIVGVGDWCDLGALYVRLQEEGHEVRVVIGQAQSQGTLRGFITTSPTLEDAVAWSRAGNAGSLIIFEDAKQGELQDRLRRDGHLVVGGSAYGSRLEGDRAFAQQELRALQLPVARTEEFSDYAAAIAFLEEVRGLWVYKYNGDRFPSTHTYVGQLADSSDVIALLRRHALHWRFDDAPSFILMERVTGVEVGVGAWFDGSDFVPGARCIDFEHKHLFPGDLGELTGEMGTLVRYRGAERIFNRVLAPMAPRLRKSGYHGWINLNTIINAQGIWPLEFTCRFGYPGFAILEPLQCDAWGDLLLRVASGRGADFTTRPEWSVGIVLTVPPFPNLRMAAEDSVGMPVSFRRTLLPEELRHLHFNEIARDEGGLVNVGIMGNLMVATGMGLTVAAARARATAIAQLVVSPNLRWRNDIGAAFEARHRQQLVAWGWLEDDTHAAP